MEVQEATKKRGRGRPIKNTDPASERLREYWRRRYQEDPEYRARAQAAARERARRLYRENPEWRAKQLELNRERLKALYPRRCDRPGEKKFPQAHREINLIRCRNTRQRQREHLRQERLTALKGHTKLSAQQIRTVLGTSRVMPQTMEL